MSAYPRQMPYLGLVATSYLDCLHQNHTILSIGNYFDRTEWF
jgi:hypothetical protein